MVIKHVALIICDINFRNSVQDFNTYKEKLFNFVVTKEEGKEVSFATITGKYSFKENLKEIPVDDKNKTIFVRTISDYLSKIDEVIIISNYRHEAFLEPLKNQLSEESIPTTLFSYETKDDGKGTT